MRILAGGPQRCEANACPAALDPEDGSGELIVDVTTDPDPTLPVADHEHAVRVPLALLREAIIALGVARTDGMRDQLPG